MVLVRSKILCKEELDYRDNIVLVFPATRCVSLKEAILLSTSYREVARHLVKL